MTKVSWIGIPWIALCGAGAFAGEPAPDATGLDLSGVSLSQPEKASPAPPGAGDTAIDATPVRLRYGAAGSRWWGLGAGVAHDFSDANDCLLFGSVSYFLVDDVEFAGEFGAWYFSQRGPDAGGVSASMVFRYHFIHEDKWTVFADVGIGVLGATDNVPATRQGFTGTSFDFLPRAGVGFTRQLTDDGARLIVGLRWHHISNARIFGDDNNPARDSAMLYAAVVFPF